tara:strand:- start:4960 stop:5142 length:183 start_codon:yes stop_codon:yes gene_type:complete
MNEEQRHLAEYNSYKEVLESIINHGGFKKKDNVYRGWIETRLKSVNRRITEVENLLQRQQ